jgi:hypothetical protein
MATLKFRSLTFVVSSAALVMASASAGARPTSHHRTIRTEYTALVDPPAVATVSHGRGAPTEEIFSRNAQDCNKLLCIGY